MKDVKTTNYRKKRARQAAAAVGLLAEMCDGDSEVRAVLRNTAAKIISLTAPDAERKDLLIRMLREQGGMTVPEALDRTGWGPKSGRKRIKEMEAEGLIEIREPYVPAGGPGRRPQLISLKEFSENKSRPSPQFTAFQRP